MGMGLKIELVEPIEAEYTTKTITCLGCGARLELTVSSLSQENKELTCPSCATTLAEKGFSVRLAIWGIGDWVKKYAPWIGVSGLVGLTIFAILKKK